MKKKGKGVLGSIGERTVYKPLTRERLEEILGELFEAKEE